MATFAAGGSLPSRRWATGHQIGRLAVLITFALSVGLAENLIQAVNIVGSIFYPVMLGLFLVGFFMPRVGATAVFCSALITQILIITHFYLSQNYYPSLGFSYLWYNLLGSVACMALSAVFQTLIYMAPGPTEPFASPE